ncbi:lasso RiPP family leader peptide-containing protein [Candidatus Zixiibacteriota bacterium]
MKPDRKSLESRSRKPYTTPRLVRFGNLREITQAKGGTAVDGQGKAATRLTAKPS